MKKLRKYFCLFLMSALASLALFVFAEAQTARKTNSNKNNTKTLQIKRSSTAANGAKTKGKVKQKMIQANRTPVAPGEWGAAGAALTVDESGAQIEYDCARGEITEKLTVDAAGKFNANGTHTRLSPGPLRVGGEPQSQPAHYEGKISGKTMTFKVVLTESGTLVGEFTLEEGKTARLRRCL